MSDAEIKQSGNNKVNVRVNLNSVTAKGFVGGVFADYTTRLFEARAFDATSNNPRYSMGIIVAKNSEAYKVFEGAVVGAMKAAYGDGWQDKFEGFRGNSGKCCYLDWKAKNVDRYRDLVAVYGDCIVISANRDQKLGAIGVFDERGTQITSLEYHKPSPGDFVNCTFDLWVQKDKTPGLRAQAINIQYVRKSNVELANGSAPPTNINVMNVTEYLGGESMDAPANTSGVSL